MKHIKILLKGVLALVFLLTIFAIILILTYLTGGLFVWVMCFLGLAYFIGVIIKDVENDDYNF